MSNDEGPDGDCWLTFENEQTCASRCHCCCTRNSHVCTARAPLLELNDCHDDLDRLRRTSSDASDAAEDAESKHEELEDCRRDAELHGGCVSQNSDYESELSDRESKLDDLDSRLRSVKTSCGYEFTINRMSGVEAAKRRICASIKKLVTLGITPLSLQYV